MPQAKTSSKTKGTMHVKREFDADIVQKLEVIPVEYLRKALDIQPTKKTTDMSKWERFIQRKKAMNISEDTLEYIRKCSQEFREDFTFKHDFIDEE